MTLLWGNARQKSGYRHQFRTFAQTDPKLFLQTYQPPILIDEVQKAPELFEEIKILCDESEERGQFWLTGSQSKKLVKRAGDSLAGSYARINIRVIITPKSI